MAELTKKKTTVSPQNQLYWFVNKLISIYENPIIILLQEYDELTCFPVDLLRKEETELFPLGRNAGATEYDSKDQEYASYCIEMLEKIKRDIPKLEEYGPHFNKEDFSWYEDNHNFEGNGYAFYLDCDYKPIFEAYLRFLNGDKTKTSVKEDIKKTDTNKFPHKLPRGTKWGNFIIKFLDQENVLIKIKQFEHTTNYKEMGFIGKGKNPEPSEAWVFLKVLATLNGELSIKDKEARDKYRKQKEILSEKLENYFSIDYDLFYPYHSSIEKGGNSYRIKIVLIPPITEEKEISSNDNEDRSDSLGIKEYLDDQYTQIYDDELDKNE